MELSEHNFGMGPAGGENLLSLRTGTKPLLHHLRESQVRMCPLNVVRSVLIVLLLKVTTTRLEIPDALYLVHSSMFLYTNG